MALTMVLDPTGASAAAGPDAPTNATLPMLAGRTIGIRHDKLWMSFDWVTAEWVDALGQDDATVVPWRSDERTGESGAEVTRSFHKFLDSVEAGIFGLASCGSCTMLTIADAVEAAKHGLPSVAVCTEQFEPLAAMLAKRDGFPGLPLVVLPFPLETRPEDEVRAIAREAYPRVRVALGVSAR
jgi:hypothetical protein